MGKSLGVGLLVLCSWINAVQAGKMTWDMKQLTQAPHMTAAPQYDQPGVKAIFFDGPTWQGQPTRVFAYYGLPNVSSGQKVPAMVLVHGGGGTAFAHWVRLWNEKGYAAIALDTTGSINADGKGKRERDPQGGPDGWGSFGQMAHASTPVADDDLWTHQAVAQVILAHSLLRSLPGVDPDRTGITGISWGGYLTCITASVDERFKIAIPIYGCGYLYESPGFAALLQKFAAIRQRWINTCDPSVYLPDAKVPFRWITGTNDAHFAMDTFVTSQKRLQAAQEATVLLNMPHSQQAGMAPAEIYACADAKLKNNQSALIECKEVRHDGESIIARYQSGVSCASAQLLFTTSTNPTWHDRPWQTRDATVYADQHEVKAKLPANVSACFINLITADGLVTSTPMVELRESQPLPLPSVSGVEDFENLSVGDGVSDCQLSAGASIRVTDTVASGGKHALAFYDAKGNMSWLPMRSRWFKGNNQITSGSVQMAFDLMQDTAKPGRFYVQLRDYDGNKFTTGLAIEIDTQGKVAINGQAAMPLTPGQWCHFQVSLSLPAGTGQCVQQTRQESRTYPLAVSGFSKIDWLGYVASGNEDAVTYLDNVAFAVTSSDTTATVTQPSKSAPPVAQASTARAFDEVEDYEKKTVGQGVEYCQVAPGTSILVTDAAACSGRHSLAFTDIKTNMSWLPMLNRWFKADDALTSGTLTLRFDMMQKADQPGKFYVHLRDYTGNQYVNGVALDIDQQGHVTLNGQPIDPMTPGQWCHFELVVDLGKQTVRAVQDNGQGRKSFDLQTNGFHKLSWWGFVASDNQPAVTYLDNLEIRYQPTLQ